MKLIEKEIDLLLKQFKSHVNGLMNCEDELINIKYQLIGLKQNRSKKGNSEALPDGTKLYKNSIIELNDKLIETRRERNYHLFAVRRVMKMLRLLSNEEVELLELYYWKELPIRVMGNRLNYSKSRVQQLIDEIIVKIGHVQ